MLDQKSHQLHPFPPLFNAESDKLILGSFPSVKSRENLFFYGHPQNRFWKVIAALFGADIPTTVDEKKSLILSNRLALWDVIAECEIVGSSDASIRHVRANDLTVILAHSQVSQIFVNGKTAEKLYIRYIEPQTHIQATVLPSTSPANAAWSLDRLIEVWRSVLL